jgi:redox-sensitive bicupin YhaK (pirin superfamily)
MKKIIHTSESRGAANFGWLDSKHSFSFGRYYNPNKLNFGTLRVLNDDIVTGGAGFGRHSHDNMEIVSIPLFGDLKHEDSTGRSEIIRTGDVQIMSAGSGIDHSEFNPNKNDSVNFLQLWIVPEKRNITPRYDQKTFAKTDRAGKFQTVVSPNDDAALWINQDAYLSLADAEDGSTLNYKFNQNGHGLYLFVLEGKVTVGGETLKKRDAIGISELAELEINVLENASLLAIEVPMIAVSF